MLGLITSGIGSIASGLGMSQTGQNILGGAMNIASGLFKGFRQKKMLEMQQEFQREMQEQQHQYELEKMGIQQDMNKEQAEYSAKLQQETWDYTNYENQRKHLEKAGLNPALLYGMSGGGGSSTGSTQAQGVSMGASEAVAMGLQARLMLAEIQKTEAEAGLANAEAAKTSGADTIKTNAETALTETIKDLNRITGDMRQSQTDVNKAMVSEIGQKIQLMGEQLNSVMIDNEIKRETKESVINKAAQEVINLGIEGALMGTQGELNEAQRDLAYKRMDQIEQEMQGFWYRLETGRITAEAVKAQAKAAADKVVNEKEYWGELTDLKGKEVVTGYFEAAFMGLNSLANALKNVQGMLPTTIVRDIIKDQFGLYMKEFKKIGK